MDDEERALIIFKDSGHNVVQSVGVEVSAEVDFRRENFADMLSAYSEPHKLNIRE